MGNANCNGGYSCPAKPLCEWTVTDVANALRAIEFPDVAKKMEEGRVDGATIVDPSYSTEELLDDLEVSNKLQRRRLTTTLKNLPTEIEKAQEFLKRKRKQKRKGLSREELPSALRDFTPISTTAGVASLMSSDECMDLHRAIQRTPDDPDTIAALNTLAANIGRAVQDCMQSKCMEKQAATALHTVYNSGNHFFEVVYEPMWQNKQIDKVGCNAYKEVAAAMKGLYGPRVQRCTEVVPLLQDAARVKPLYDTTVRDLFTDMISANAVEVQIPSELKSVGRIVEKVCLNAADPGNASRVFDVVRGMIDCPDMGTVAKVLERFEAAHKNKQIVLVRGKERFYEQPAPGGWHDYMICFYMTADPNKHICEVQIVHHDLLVMRKELNGHAVFSRARNASELLAMMHACRRTFAWTEEDAVRAGFSDEDMEAAGFDTQQSKAKRAAARQEAAEQAAKDQETLEHRRNNLTSEGVEAQLMAWRERNVAPDEVVRGVAWKHFKRLGFSYSDCLGLLDRSGNRVSAAELCAAGFASTHRKSVPELDFKRHMSEAALQFGWELYSSDNYYSSDKFCTECWRSPATCTCTGSLHGCGRCNDRYCDCGCFTGDSLVTLSNGGTRRADAIRIGDEVHAPTSGTARVVGILPTRLVGATLCTVSDGLRITRRHPIRMSPHAAKSGQADQRGGGGAWVWPCNVTSSAQQHVVSSVEVFSFLLDKGHTMIVGGVEVLCLGHNHEVFGPGYATHPCFHPVFGTAAVHSHIQQRGEMDEIWAMGANR